MANKIDRLNRLEKAMLPKDPPVILVCWCGDDIPEGEHYESCPCYGLEFDKVVRWEDDPGIIRVRYDRGDPPPAWDSF